MAHDNEYRLVSKVIVDRDINPVIEAGIKDDWIVDDDIRRIWKFVREHYSRYSEVPTYTTVKDNFPNFQALNVEDTIDYLIDQMIAFRRKTIALQGANHIVEQLQSNDHESAIIEMSNTVTLVNAQGVQGTTHVDLNLDPYSRVADYARIKDSVLLGVPTGFKKIDEATAGLQGGQLITVIAPPKTGKSQLALKMAINIHDTGKVPMFQSFEMNNREQTQRHDAIRAHLDHNKLRRGVLDSIELERYETMLEKSEGKQPFHLVDAINGLTVDSLIAKAEQLKPDVLFVDGVYLMMDSVTGEANTPQALTNITRALKRVAQRLDIPVVITTQTLLWKMKGNKVSADSIGYSSSFFQDSDVILGLENVEDNDLLHLLRVVQSRNCGPQETSLVWNWTTGCFHDESDQVSCKYCVPWSAS